MIYFDLFLSVFYIFLLLYIAFSLLFAYLDWALSPHFIVSSSGWEVAFVAIDAGVFGVTTQTKTGEERRGSAHNHGDTIGTTSNCPGHTRKYDHSLYCNNKQPKISVTSQQDSVFLAHGTRWHVSAGQVCGCSYGPILMWALLTTRFHSHTAVGSPNHTVTLKCFPQV